MNPGRDPLMNKEEYMDRIAGLFEKIKAETGTKDQAVLLERYRDAEFDLLVEYKLGADFSQKRWGTLRHMHRQWRKGVDEIKKQFQSGKLSKEEFASQMQSSLDEMVNSFGSALTPEELSKLCGAKEGEAGLALDLDSI